MAGKEKWKKKTSILLVVPKYCDTNEIDYNYLFPLGIGYISSVLKKEGYDVTCLNMNHCKGGIREIISRELDKKKFDFVGTGHTGIGYPVVKKILNAVREHKSKPLIVLGGQIVTSEPKLMFENLRPDFAVIGEGEETIIELIEAVKKKNLRRVKGIVFWDKKGNAVYNEKREYVKNIDKLPYPDFEGFGLNEFLNHMCANRGSYNDVFDYPRAYPILCSRACQFQCTFCYRTLGEKYRERSIDEVMKEIESVVKKYNINMIRIYDDLFAVKKERIYEFCKRIKELSKNIGRELKWSCQLIVSSNLDEEMLQVMKDTGCYLVAYGFESFSPEVLRSMKKPITPEQIDKALKLTLKAGLGIQANFIFGDIAETNETSARTLDYWKKNCKGQVGLGFIQPYPGSEIYHHCLKKGVIKDKLYFIEHEIPHDILLNMTDKMSDKEIQKLFDRLVFLRNKYTHHTSPYYVKHMQDDRYEIKFICPFCKSHMHYKNYHLQGKYIYNSFVPCRKCHMRFFVCSPLIKMARKFYFLAPIKKRVMKVFDRE